MIVSPSIIVNHQSESIKISPLSIRFWDKFKLEPYGGQKNIQYVIVQPACRRPGVGLKHKVLEWFDNFNSVFQMLQLGLHQPVDLYKNGVDVHLASIFY